MDIERMREWLHAEADALASRHGIVELEIIVGEEPEEGVEVEVTTGDHPDRCTVRADALIGGELADCRCIHVRRHRGPHVVAP